MDRGFSLRTYLWAAGCAFILAASLSFLAFLYFELPWWTMVVMLGLLVAGVVEALEHALARPLERLTRAVGRTRDGVPVLPPPPGGWAKTQEFTRLWRGLRFYQDHLTQSRHAKTALETQAATLRAQVGMLALAGQALEPDVSVEKVGPQLLKDLAVALGVPDLYLVPLRRHCPVPVMGGQGTPAWAEAIRASGLGPWEDLLAQGKPVNVCLTALAPAWRTHWGEEACWVVPLNYHGKAQGLLISAPGAARTLTPEELTLVSSLAQILACALHPPRWSDDRRPTQVQRTAAADEPTETPAPESPEATDESLLELPAGERTERRRRRRQKKGA